MPQYDKLQIYFNGEFKPLSEAKLSIFDHGVMLGDMVFEMTRTFNHQPFMLDAHLDRLMASCKVSEIDPGLSRAELGDLSRQIVEMNDNRFAAGSGPKVGDLQGAIDGQAADGHAHTQDEHKARKKQQTLCHTILILHRYPPR